MKILGKLLAVLFSIIYFFALTCLMTVAFLSNIVSKDYYVSIFENINLETLKVSDLEEFFDTDRYDSNTTIEDVIIDYFNEEDIDDEKVKALLNDKKVRKEASNVIGEIISYAMGGEKPEITRDEVKNFFNNKTITDIIGIPTDENIDEVYNEIINAIEEIGGDNNGTSKRNSNNIEIYR